MLDDDDDEGRHEALMRDPGFQEWLAECFRKSAERDRRPPNLRVETSDHPCDPPCDFGCEAIRQAKGSDFCAFRWCVVDDDPVVPDNAVCAFGFSSLKEAQDYADDINEQWRRRNAN
jgi:hypothetical protein